MERPAHRIDTKLIHAGEPSPRIAGAVAMPVFQSSTYTYGGEDSYHDVRYIRLNNTPNHVVLHDKPAALEGAEAALVTGSGYGDAPRNVARGPGLWQADFGLAKGIPLSVPSD